MCISIYGNVESSAGVDAMPSNNPKYECERRQRESAVNFARASIGLEGFGLTEDDEELTRRYVIGEIDLAYALKFVHNAIHQR